MSTPDNSEPLLLAGELPQQSYSTLQAFVNDLVKVLRIPIDTIAVIKGANGEKGNKGDKGSRGDRGPSGAMARRVSREFPIPAGDYSLNQYIDIPYFAEWRHANYNFISNLSVEDGMTTSAYPLMSAGIVARTLNTGGSIRVFFSRSVANVSGTQLVLGVTYYQD